MLKIFGGARPPLGAHCTTPLLATSIVISNYRAYISEITEPYISKHEKMKE